MNNRERIVKQPAYHIMVALRRKKDPGNRPLQELCFREVVYSSDRVAVNVLKARIDNQPGVWRIYQTINKRLVEPARKLLMIQLIKEPEKFNCKVDGLWKNCLLQSECKATKKFMLDIDANWSLDEVVNFNKGNEIIAEEIIKTPNGWHVISDHIDTRKLQGVKDVEVKRDSCKFIEKFEVKDGK